MRKQNLLMWVIAVFIVFTAGHSLAQGNGKGPKISIVEDEVEQVDEKTKIKSKLSGPTEIQFLDETGKVKKKISLNSEIIYEPTEKDILKGVTKKGEMLKIKKLKIKSSKMSKNSKFIVITYETGERGIKHEDGSEELFSDGETEEATVELYDVKGTLLWKKELPKGRAASGDFMVSDNGETVVVKTWDSLYRLEEEAKNVIIIFDSEGREILRIPSKEEYAKNNEFEAHSIDNISSNGLYIAIYVNNNTRFYNLKNKKYWDSPKLYTIYSITDDGIARGSIGGYSTSKSIDLKQYIGD